MYRQIQEHLREVEKHSAAIRDIQSKCLHKNNSTKNGANTGNYDPSSDCYWVDVTCLDCNKQRRYYSDENREEYLKYS